MMINKHENVLKGQHNLAQGKRRRSVALGCRAGEKIVREIMVKKEYFLFRTKGKVSDNQQIKSSYSVRRSFSFIPFTQGDISDRSSRNFALG